MSLYDGTPRVTAGRIKKPTYVYMCRSALTGTKEDVAWMSRRRDVREPILHLELAWESVRVVDKNQVWFVGITRGGWRFLGEFDDVAVGNEGGWREKLIGRAFVRPFLLLSHPSALRTGLCLASSSHQLPTLTSCSSSPRVRALAVCQSVLLPVFRPPPLTQAQDFSTTTSTHAQDFNECMTLTHSPIHSAWQIAEGSGYTEF
jgi:hypothetical protein